jgi:four helix bundle protein
MEHSRSYRDLIVWQKSINMVKTIYGFTRSFPGEEMYGITMQMRRAGVSIPANIAEGQARSGKKEFLQFLGIAQGSLAEVETLLTISEDLGYLSKKNFEKTLQDCKEIARLLAALKRSLL